MARRGPSGGPVGPNRGARGPVEEPEGPNRALGGPNGGAEKHDGRHPHGPGTESSKCGPTRVNVKIRMMIIITLLIPIYAPMSHAYADNAICIFIKRSLF